MFETTYEFEPKSLVTPQRRRVPYVCFRQKENQGKTRIAFEEEMVFTIFQPKYIKTFLVNERLDN